MSQSSDFNCKDVMFERKFDICKMTDDLLNSMYLSVFLKDVRRAAKFDIKCPYHAGHYVISNFTLLNVPRMPLPSSLFICTTTKILVKVSNAKKFEHLLTLESFLSYNT